ncbi:unnamed protein product [Leptidea sinapis]|uniref:Uncharacterized protein n=1 Tax=Leptidea sinapis TaxID=189913 RepID=A0A5E4QR18_9NEOP|nr:unnamed protein product [Leptidea sinapis]
MQKKEIKEDVIELYGQRDWRSIVNKYHNHPDRNKLLWVFPAEEDFEFIRLNMEKLGSGEILSIGCGSGLLEWMIHEATDIPVSGVEVDGSWWACKYAPPTFIELIIASPALDYNTISLLKKPTTTILFCYFNNGPAFRQYMENFNGNVVIIIGPHSKNVYTCPEPFEDIGKEWDLHTSKEIRDSKDFIAIYVRCLDSK